MKSNRTKGIIALFILSFVFATFGIFNRYLNTNFSVFRQSYLRIFTALLITFIVFYKDIHLKKFFSLPRKEWFIVFLRTVFLYGFAANLNIVAFNTTTYSNVSFLGAIPTTALLGFLFLQEKVTMKKILIIFLAFLGVLLISSRDLFHAFVWGRGQIVSIIADIFFSLMYISRKWHADILNNKEITFLIFVIGFFIQFGLSMIFDHHLPINGWEINYLYAIIAVSCLSVANQFLINYGFQHVKAVLANNIIALESLFALFIGLLIYREIPTLQALFGGFLILLSVPLMNREEAKEKA